MNQRGPYRYVLSLGSNRGNRERHINTALQEMHTRGVTVLGRSSLYRTSPVDNTRQEDFYNMSVLVASLGKPQTLLRTLKGIERDMGRKSRSDKGPRIIDVDIILWENGGVVSPDLTIPHSRWTRRLFVLQPTAEVLECMPEFGFNPDEVRTVIHENADKFRGQIVEKIG